MLMALCLVDFLGMNLLAFAYQLDNSAFLAIIQYMIVVYSFIVDSAIFKVPITGFDLLGASLIFTVTVSTAVYKLYHIKSN